MALLHFLAYFIFTSCLVAGQQTRYVLKGLEVNLNPGISKPPDNILWMHKGNKVVEFNGLEEDVYDPFTDRITLNWHTAELSITNLGFQDTGDYELEAWVDGKTHTSKFNLEVIDEVPKPTISCEMTDCSSSNMSATLVCATDAKQPQSSIKLEWSSNGITQPGSKLTIPLGKENDDEVYTCTVSNPLSAETATFTAKDCHSDCSSVAPIIIPILVIMLVLVGLGIIIMCCKRHHKACFAKAERDDVEKQSKSGATKVSGSPAETEFLLKKSTPEGDTDSNQGFAKVENKDSQDETPQKGLVEKMRGVFESPGTKQSPGKKWWKEKDKDKPGETAPSLSQQREPPSPSDQKKLVRGEEGDADEDQLGKQQTEVSQSGKEPDQAEVSATSGDNNPETFTSPERPSMDITLSKLDSERSEEKNKHSASEKNKNEETAPSSPAQQSEAPPPSDQNNLSSSDKGDADSDWPGKQETEISHSDNEAAQPGVLSSSQDTKPNQETSTSPEQPVSGSAAENEPLGNNASTFSSNQKQHEGGSNLIPDETAKSHEGDADSAQDTAEVENKDSQDETPQKGLVEKMRGVFETPGKSKDKPGETAPSLSQQHEPPSPSDQKKPVSSEEGDADEDQLGKQQTEVSQSSNDADQADVSATSGEDNPETFTSPEQPKLKKEADEDEEKKSPTDVVSPAAQSNSPLTQTSQNMTPGETTDEHKGDANSDQVHGETKRGSRDSDSSDVEKTNQSDDSLENKQDPINSEEKVSEMTPEQQDSNFSEKEEEKHEDKEQAMSQSGSAEGNGSQSGGHSKDVDEQPDKQSTTEPGENNSDTTEESLDAAQNDKNSQESDKDRDEKYAEAAAELKKKADEDEE